MKKFLASIVLFYSLFFILSSKVMAQYGQYGAPTPSQTIMVTKMVAMPNADLTDPTQGNYVNNLSPTDPRFIASEYIFFKVTIQNTSTVTLHNVVFTDFVPDFLTPVSGPGSFDTTNRIITFNIGDMVSGAQNIYYLQMQVANQATLPSEQGVFCKTNTAQASADNTAIDQSTSQFCIEIGAPAVTPTPTATPTPTIGVTTVPSTGPEFDFLVLGANIIALTTGIYLKKKS